MSQAFELRRDRHAIGEFAASIDFFKRVTPATFADVSSCLKKLAAQLDLPAPMNMQVISLDIANGHAGPQLADGIGRQRYTSNGEVALSVFCDPDSIHVTSRDYSVWEEMKPTLISCFEPLAKIYINEVPAITKFTLRYLNEFKSREPGTKSVTELFKANSGWLPSFAIDMADAWHSHNGRYEQLNENMRRLVIMNANSIEAILHDDGETYSFLNLILQIGMHYDIPGRGPLSVSSDKLESLISDHFEQAHFREKELLQEIISDSYLEAMGAKS